MRNLAIIPARSGSKGLPNKNIKKLSGKPLMAYSIEAAIKSGMFEEIMVSTDSEEYAQIAREYGAKVPFLRSEENSSDSASSWEMVLEVLDNYKLLGKQFDTICLLQPTSPFRTANDIRNAYELYQEKATVSVVSVCEMEHSPIWCNQLNDEASLDGFIKRDNNVQRQKSETYYRLNGAIYIVKIEELLKDSFLYRKGSYAYVMDINKSIDIDTELDFMMAEALVEVFTKNRLIEL